MLATSLLCAEVRHGKLEPCYLGPAHLELARAVIACCEAHEGRSHGELEAALAEVPGTAGRQGVACVEGPADASGSDRRVVAGLHATLGDRLERAIGAPLDPRRLRAAVFVAAARELETDRRTALAEAARSLGLEAGAPVERWLYADLRRERVVRLIRPLPTAPELLERYNFRLLQGLFLHADRVRIEVDGRSGGVARSDADRGAHGSADVSPEVKPDDKPDREPGGEARAIYRLARLHGLIVEAKTLHGDGAFALEVTGPLSLFQRTLKYGRALAAFLPACTLARRFRIEARVRLCGRDSTLVVTHADPILSPHRPPRRFDSALEERFHRDFTALGSRWDLRREERLLQVDGAVYFPDFTLRLRDDPRILVDLEVIGFWTREYLARKRALLRNLAGARMIFCVDARLSCDADGDGNEERDRDGGDGKAPSPGRGTGEAPGEDVGAERQHAVHIPFRGRVPAEAVLEALERFARAAPSPREGL